MLNCQIRFSGENNLHEMANPIFWENKKKIQNAVCRFFFQLCFKRLTTSSDALSMKHAGTFDSDMYSFQMNARNLAHTLLNDPRSQSTSTFVSAFRYCRENFAMPDFSPEKKDRKNKLYRLINCSSTKCIVITF